MSALLVKSGPLCTVQDLGRPTGRRVGVAPGGAMDQHACLWANRLLSNDPRAPVLEITLGGAAITFSEAATLALTGAECEAQLDGKSVTNWRTLRVFPGQTLRYGYSHSGLRAYLAFPGGLDAPVSFGSASVVLREGLAGRLGRAMVAGDSIEWLGGQAPERMRSAPSTLISHPVERIDLPLIPAYEWHRLSSPDRDAVWAGEWTVSVASDRVATRLEGPTLLSGPRSLDSTPMVDGTVQIPGNGVPLVFMRDRPTIGGYPKLGSVDPGALDRLAQARPGTRIGFVAADRTQVLANIRKRRVFFGLS